MKGPAGAGDQGPPARDGKRACREAALAWRRSLAAEGIRDRSRAMNEALVAWPPLRARRHVLGFEPLRREPQCQALLAALRARGVFVAVPRVEGPHIRPWRTDLARAVPPASLDAVLVPGLAFDRRGGRLGRGGGHYDRLLAVLDPHCLRIGLCFDGQVVAMVPREPWDQPVDALATESGVTWAANRGREPGA